MRGFTSLRPDPALKEEEYTAEVVQLRPNGGNGKASAFALSAALEPLKGDRRFIDWRWEVNEKGKRTKVPYCANNPRRKASSTDPATWSDYETAAATHARGEADGIGYCLYGRDCEFGAFDLDNCRDPETGEIAPWAP